MGASSAWEASTPYGISVVIIHLSGKIVKEEFQMLIHYIVWARNQKLSTQKMELIWNSMGGPKIS